MTHQTVVTMSNLHQVLEQSIQLPVLFYFWSERSPHCQPFTVVLEKLATEYGNQFVLATVNCDTEPQIAAHFGLRVIPTIYLFKNGQPADGLQGPQSEATLRDLLQRFLPKEAEIKAAQAAELIAAGKMADALPLLKEARHLAPKQSDIGLMLAEVQIALNRSEEAVAILAAIPLQDQNAHYQTLMAKIELLKQAANTPEIQLLQQEVAKDPDDPLLASQLALQWHQVGRHEEALTLLLNHLRKDLNAGDGGVRKTMLDILTALGTNDSLANKYRRPLYSLMH